MPKRKVPREHLLPERLTAILDRLPGVTMATISRKIGVKGDAVARWARGVSEPNLTHLVRLADYLQVSLDDLLGRKHQASEQPLPEGWTVAEVYRLVERKLAYIGDAPMPVVSSTKIRAIALPESWTPTVPWATGGDLVVIHGEGPSQGDPVILADGTIGYVEALPQESTARAKPGRMVTLQGLRGFAADSVLGVIIAHLRCHIPPAAALHSPEGLSETELLQYLAATYNLPPQPLRTIVSGLVELRNWAARRTPETPPPFPWWAASAAAHTPPGTTPPPWEMLGPAGMQAVMAAMQALYQQWWAQADDEQRKRVWEQWQNLTQGPRPSDNGNTRSDMGPGKGEPPS